jgi:hypothetical protein
MRTSGYRTGVWAGESRFVVLGRRNRWRTECWGVQLRLFCAVVFRPRTI